MTIITRTDQLLDHRWWNTAGPPIRPEALSTIRNAYPLARRYVFDGEACRFVGQVLRDAYDLVMENIEFARTPYPVTYIEFTDQQALFEEWTAGSADETADSRLAILFANGRMFSFAANDQHADASLLPFSLGWNTPQRYPLNDLFGDHGMYKERPLGGTLGETSKRAWMFGCRRRPEGGDYHQIIMPCDPQVMADLSPQFDMASTFKFPATVKMQQGMVECAFRGSGDMAVAAAALLMLTRPRQQIIIAGVPHARGISRGKPVVYKAHSSVTVHLRQRETVTHIMFGHRRSPRRHDVAGHWAHWHHRIECEHKWQALNEDRTRYKCERCPTLRTWRAAHPRGDGGIGIVTKDYVVTE